jgi:saccharopine dehydrogenase-like NADP-dependent oxidoreductase
LLADEPRLKLVIASRSHNKARAFCASDCSATLVPCRFDRAGDLVEQIEPIKPDIVVDATGSFQMYGDDPYRIVRAAIACNADYLDLADGSDFVLGIGELDELAKSTGRFVLSGTSTCPA